MSLDVERIVGNFKVEGQVIFSEPFGCGHINDTYAVYCKREVEPPLRYILQRINTDIFDAEKLTENICKATDYLKGRIAAEGGDPSRNTLTLVKTKDERFYYQDENSKCFRIYLFIENTVSYQNAVSAEILENAGKAFGHFQRLLENFDAGTLHEVIPDFHNTRKRYNAFIEAVRNGIPDRVDKASCEIDFAKKREEYCDKVISILGSDEIPLRVTHNDTKLNNILMDAKTGESVCIIDLDTIMPGSLLYDFGDSIRFGANTALEDETDLSKVNFSMEMFKAYTKGFMNEMGSVMTSTEKNLIPFSCILMTYECGIRFLSDYLVGDTYFKVTHDTHNLERARNQFKLISDMEEHLDEMKAFVNGMNV